MAFLDDDAPSRDVLLHAENNLLMHFELQIGCEPARGRTSRRHGAYSIRNQGMCSSLPPMYNIVQRTIGPNIAWEHDVRDARPLTRLLKALP